jgi:hypothetical protein
MGGFFDMSWAVGWSLGFPISAALQVFVSTNAMRRTFGRAGVRGFVTLAGAASSRCSYAPVSIIGRKVSVITLCAAPFFIGLGAADASTACPPARPAVDVAVEHGQLAEVADVTLAELGQVAREQAGPLHHPLLGAYTRSIAIALNIDDAVDEISGGLRCTVPEAVHVKLTLTHRVAHLPRDFAGDPCLLELSRTHERKHADADDALLDRLIAKYREDLRFHFAALKLDPAPSETEARLHMTEAARNMVQQALDSYERDQATRVGAAVDTPEEVARLSDACGGVLKSANPL